MRLVGTEMVIVTDASARGPEIATWGQRALWYCAEWMGEYDYAFNGQWPVELPEGVTLAQVLEALRALTWEHEALRTTFRVDDGVLRQVVNPAGQVAVEVHRAEPGSGDEVIGELVPKLVTRRLDPMSEWPWRAAVVVEDDRPTRLLLVFSHLTLDGRASMILLRRFDELLAGAEPTRPDWQPVDQAGFERSEAGRAISAKAIAHWQRTLRAAPTSLFDFPTVAPQEDRFWKLTMHSAAVTTAAQVVSGRLRVSTSAVLLAATATALRVLTGHSAAVLQVICDNRDDDRRADLVSTLSWDGVFRSDLGGLTFSEAVRRCYLASLNAYRYGYYDPEDEWRVWAEESKRRGARVDLGAHFNDTRPKTGYVADPPEVSEEELAGLSTRTEITFDGGLPKVDALFYMTTWEVDGVTKLSLQCDTAYLPPDTMRALLRGIERLLTRAAVREVEEEELPVVMGVAPVERDERWVRCSDGWVDLEATKALWDSVHGRGVIETEPDDAGAHRLVARVPAGGRTVAEWDDAFFAAIGNRTDVRAPQRYVVESPTGADVVDLR